MNHFDLVQATTAGAVAAHAHVGKGDKLELDWAATAALRSYMNTRLKGGHRIRVALGEYEKDKSWGLVFDELLGDGWCPGDPSEGEGEITGEVVVDPVEGTTRAANGQDEALCVMAYAPGRDAFFTSREHYMMKLAYGPSLAHGGTPLSLSTMNARQIFMAAGEVLGRPPAVAILDRPRHESLLTDAHAEGCRVLLWGDCDFTAAVLAGGLASASARQPDLYIGIGGVTEGVLAAAAIEALDGDFQCYLTDKDGRRLGEVMTTLDLIRSPASVACTGVTCGSLTDGVRSHADSYRYITDTILFDGIRGGIHRIVSNSIVPPVDRSRARGTR